MGRVALVTGGTRGIGEAICVALKDNGYEVVANYGGNEQAAAEFTKRTGIKAVKFDVSDFDQVAAGIQSIESSTGPIEVLVNNAGIARDVTMHKMSFEQWDKVIQTNLASCFNTCRCVIEGMRERKFGRIVNIGSVNGQAGQYGQVNYAAAKSGIHGFTKHWPWRAPPRESPSTPLPPDMWRPTWCGPYRQMFCRKSSAPSGRPPGAARGYLAHGAISGRGQRHLHNRLDPLHQWGSAHVLMA